MLLCLIFGVLGLAVGYATGHYLHTRYDGFVDLEEDPGGVVRANLIMNGDPETLLTTKKSIHFKIKRDEVSRS